MEVSISNSSWMDAIGEKPLVMRSKFSKPLPKTRMKQMQKSETLNTGFSDSSRSPPTPPPKDVRPPRQTVGPQVLASIRESQRHGLVTPRADHEPPPVPVGLVTKVTHNHHIDNKSELLGFLKDIRVKVNDQWTVEGILNITAKNGFLYIDFIPLRTVTTYDHPLRRWQTSVNDPSEYKCNFCLRDIASIKFTRVKRAAMIMSPIVDHVTFELNTVLPFDIPVFEFGSHDDVLSMVCIIERRGVKVTRENITDHEGSFRIDSRIVNDEQYRISVSSITQVSKKANSDKVRLASRKQWRGSHIKFTEPCSDTFIDTHTVDELRTVVKYQGCKPRSRLRAWALCCGQDDSTIQMYADVFKRLKQQWELFLPEQKRRWQDIKSIEIQIDKDQKRTVLERITWTTSAIDVLRNVLQCHAIYDMETMYMQGMNEICAVCMELANSETETFTYFELVMNVLRPYYRVHANTPELLGRLGVIIRVIDKEVAEAFDANGVEYTFTYRPLLLLFKREFTAEDIVHVWDFVMAKPEDQMQLFVMAAIILLHREYIIIEQPDFDTMLQFVQTLSGTVETGILIDADMLHSQFMKNASEEERRIVFSD